MISPESHVYQNLVHLEKTSVKESDFAEKFSRTWEDLVQSMSDIGGRSVENAEEMIQILARKNPGMIVRRETPKPLLNVLSKGERLQIRFDPEAHGKKAYPNAGVLGDDGFGLKIPFQRGFGKIDETEGGQGKTVCIVGFMPGEGIRSKTIPRDEYPHYPNGRERGLIRMVEGEVPSEDIRFILLRIPRSHVPDDFLTDREEELDKQFISRVFVFNEFLEKEKTEAA
jgi:hypothetical protein